MEFLITTIVAVILLVSVVSSCPSVCSCTDNVNGLEVDCALRGLDSIPTDLPNNTYYFYLNSNQITSIQPGAFNNLTSLTFLYLRANQIKSIQPGVFNDLSSLNQLSLSYNQIKSIQPGVFNDLSSLNQLYLRANQIKSIQPGVFNDLSSLNQLSLSYNQIKSIQPGVFNDLSSLNQLSLSYNEITSIQSGTFNNLPSLNQLYLYSNQITSIQEGAFYNLTSLTTLNLHSNQITSIQPGVFNDLSNLNQLYLYSNQITSIQEGAFSNLPSLTQLSLHSNQITSIQEGAFNNFPSLTELLLRNNPISFVSGNAFQNLPQLTSLEFDMHCGDCDTIPFCRWLNENQTFSKSVTCNDYDGKKLTSLQPNDFTGCFILPSSISIENVTPEKRLLGTEGRNITVSCKVVGGTPAPNVVLIIAGQTVASQPQSAKYTLTTINRYYDHKTVTCQASNHAYLQKMTDSAMIYLNLRPLPPTITGNVDCLEETTSLDVTCTSTGSRPRATLQWTIGQRDITSNAIEWSSHTNATDTYAVLSVLTYSVEKSHNEQVLICKAVNVAASSGLQTSITLNVKLIQETSSSGLYAVIGGMAGVIAILLTIVIILATLLFRRKKDLQQRGENVSTTTYEMLGMQDITNTYGDLSSEQEQRQPESTTEQYETMGET